VYDNLETQDERPLQKEASPSPEFHCAIPNRLYDLTPPPLPPCWKVSIASMDGRLCRLLVYWKERKGPSTSATLNILYSTEFKQKKGEKEFSYRRQRQTLLKNKARDRCSTNTNVFYTYGKRSRRPRRGREANLTKKLLI